MTDPATRGPGGVPEARQRRTRWPGWVWLIPLVAAGFAGWLAFEEWVVGPRPLSVHFASVEGIKPGAPVRYKGVQVGSVDAIRLDDDLQGATLVLDMTALRGHLGPGTRIWIARPGLAPGEIGSLISGPYLAIAPDGDGSAELEELQGLDAPPILEPDAPGRAFVLTVDNGEGIDAGAPVRFRGIEVGRVLGKRFGEDGRVEIPVFVRGDYAALVREATVFWRAGGLALDKGAGGLDVRFPSLGALATGAVAFDTPEVLSGEPAGPGARFALWESRDAAATATTGPRFDYMLVFAQPVGDLAQGAPVTLAGKQVGHVAGTDLEVAPDGSGLVTPVRIVIDARRMAIDDLAAIDSREVLRDRLNQIVERLVMVGMRAEVAEGGIVFGARSIELVIDPAAPAAAFDPAGEPPRIPTAGGGPRGADTTSDAGQGAPGADAGADATGAGAAIGGAGATGGAAGTGGAGRDEPAGTSVPGAPAVDGTGG